MYRLCQVMNAPYVVNTTKNKVEYNLWDVYQEEVQLCLKYPGKYTEMVHGAKWLNYHSSLSQVHVFNSAII